MHALPLSEFRANVAAVLDLVEQGQTVRLLRHGKPVAELVPVPPEGRDAVPAWKQAIEPATLAPADGKTVSQHLIAQREGERP